MEKSTLLLLADTILITHVLFVVFVVGGLATIYIGHFLQWQWVRNMIFRITHLIAIGIVAIQSWLGIICPLTTWEMALREKAGAETYSGSFIQHWLQNILYFSAPEWVFIVVYTVFCALVIASWFLIRPRKV